MLQLKNNSIGGTIPVSLLNNLSKIETLDISHNLLLGTLPSNLFPLIGNNNYIDLSHNLISGEIPSQLAHFLSIRLSYNKLNGAIPQNICNVTYVDISYNSLKGRIPQCINPYMIVRNKDLCSDISNNQIHLPVEFEPCSVPKKSNKTIQSQRQQQIKIFVIVFPIVNIILILAFSLYLCLRFCHISVMNNHANTATTMNGDLFCIWNYDGKIAHDDIIKATKDFDMRYCIGTGAYGSVYKAQLPSGKVVALKKLHGYEAEVPSFDESFKNEVRILSEIKHRHIVKLYGFCLHKRIYHVFDLSVHGKWKLVFCFVS
jgi:hypothetical protein